METACQPLPAAIVIGETGSGKSSVINLIVGSDVAQVSNGTTRCTSAAEKYVVALPNSTKMTMYDTLGLHHKGNTSASRKAITDIHELIRVLESDLSLLLYVIRGPTIHASTVNGYQIVCEALGTRKVPMIAVITGMEGDDSSHLWWNNNQSFFQEHDMVFADHVCITATKGKFRKGDFVFSQEYSESQTKITNKIVSWGIEYRLMAKPSEHSTEVVLHAPARKPSDEKYDPFDAKFNHFDAKYNPFDPKDLPTSGLPVRILREVSNPAQLNLFMDWTKRPENRSPRLAQMFWCKEPVVPGHEYIVLRFDFGISHTWLRLERDSTSWLSIFGQKPQENSRKNCKDTVCIQDDTSNLSKPGDKIVASLNVAGQPHPIMFLHLALLQRHINERANVYDLATFNCWWYAGSVWETVAYWLQQAKTEAIFHIIMNSADDRRIAENTTPVAGRMRRPLDSAATVFPRNLLHAQLTTAQRVLPTRKWSGSYEEVEKASEELREYASTQLLDDAETILRELRVEWGG